MSKYSKVKKAARSIARETSHQFHNVKDDITRIQIQRERNKSSKPTFNNSSGAPSFKFSDIEKWMDHDISFEDDDLFPSPTDTTVSASTVSASTVSASAGPDSLFDDDLFEDPLTKESTEPVGIVNYHTLYNEAPVTLEPLTDDKEEQVPITTEEQVPITTEEQVPITTEEQVPITGEEQVPVTDEEQVPVTDEEPVTNEEVVQIESVITDDKETGGHCEKEDVQTVNNIQTSSAPNEEDIFFSYGSANVSDELFNSTEIPPQEVTEEESSSLMTSIIDHPLQEDDEINYVPIPVAPVSSSIPNSSPESYTSPLSLSPLPHSPSSKLTVNNSGKLVPVVPPRPNSASKVSSITSSVFDELTAPVINEQIAPPPSDDDNFKLVCLSLCVLLLYLYYSLNPFNYLAGFMAGFMLFYITIGTAFVLYVQYSEREKEHRNAMKKKDTLPSVDQLPQTIQVDFEGNRILKSNKFGLVFQYHPSTHHPSQRYNAKVRLYKDFQLEVRYKTTVSTPQGSVITRDEIITQDLRKCSVLIVPEEVADNRKRRWSKKFPISISWSNEDEKGHLFLFPFTSREKEEWFRRLRSSADRIPYDTLSNDITTFYRYMSSYMPRVVSPSLNTPTTTSSIKHNVQRRPKHHHHHTVHKGSNDTVTFSATDSGLEQEEDTSTNSISIKEHPNHKQFKSRSSTSNSVRSNVSPSLRRKQNTDSLPLTIAIGWINAFLARLAWDLWHEERWKNWVTSRIQRKLIRIKTPPFLEELKVTEVNMGIDMPVLKRPSKVPKLNQQGIWIYLEVEYIGSFTMTIETKLKLDQPKGEVLHFTAGHATTESNSLKRHHGNRIRAHTTSEDEISSGSDEEEDTSSSLSSLSSSVTQSMEIPNELESQGITLPTSKESVESNNDSSQSTYGPPGKREKLLTNVVSKIQKIAAKSKLVAKAAEKVSSYPLILTVEVKRLDGLLVLNMGPPPSDAIWYGFVENPNLELVAKPRLGHREVTLSYVTDWIEKKLCDVVEKKLVLPNMEDIVVPILNSGLTEDGVKNSLNPSNNY